MRGSAVLTTTVAISACLLLLSMRFTHWGMFAVAEVGPASPQRAHKKWDLLHSLHDTQRFLDRRLVNSDGGSATQPARLWSTDFHISPVADVKGVCTCACVYVRVQAPLAPAH